MPAIRGSWALLPFHAAALGSGAKSFRDNPLIGSPFLNRRGLHVSRMQIAAKMVAWRRDSLAKLISAEDLSAFTRDGFVVRYNFLSPRTVRQLRAEMMTIPGNGRDMRQGSAITRRIPLDIRAQERYPTSAALLKNPEWLGLLRYVGASALTPLVYVQSIFSHACEATTDPQTLLHADTFHSSVKAWFFLTDVSEEEGAFVYVPGSHRLTRRRLAWERKMSINAARNSNFQTSRGSLRITEQELSRLYTTRPVTFAVPSNTLIVADTLGFHARGVSARPSCRVEIFAYGRRNPFLPWTGLDPVGLPLIRDHAVPASWFIADLAESLGLKVNPWRKVGEVLPQTPARSVD